MDSQAQPTMGEMLLYQTEDGQTRLEIRLQDKTVWMSQQTLAELFQTTVANINIHLKNVYEEGELSETATVKDYLIVRREGSWQVQRAVRHYNLEAIVEVGYRVKSPRGSQFRRWATVRLKEVRNIGFDLQRQDLVMELNNTTPAHQLASRHHG